MYSGYNHIHMDPKDQEKTSFQTNHGTFCYNMMPFGLKSAGATYQRLVNRMFEAQIGKPMEVYIVDSLVKSREDKDHLEHLGDTFAILRKYNMS